MEIARQQHILSAKTILLASYFVAVVVFVSFSSHPKRFRRHGEKKEFNKKRREQKKREQQHLAIKNWLASCRRTHTHIHIFRVVYVPGVLQWHWLIFVAFNILKESVNRQRYDIQNQNMQTKGSENRAPNSNEMTVQTHTHIAHIRCHMHNPKNSFHSRRFVGFFRYTRRFYGGKVRKVYTIDRW